MNLFPDDDEIRLCVKCGEKSELDVGGLCYFCFDENRPTWQQRFRPSRKATGNVSYDDIGRFSVEIARDKSLTVQERAVLRIFYERQSETMKRWVALATRDIEQQTGIGRTKAREILAGLRQRGILMKVQIGPAFHPKTKKYNAPSYRYITVAERDDEA